MTKFHLELIQQILKQPKTINNCKSSHTNNNQLILEGLIRAMPQLTERNQLM